DGCQNYDPTRALPPALSRNKWGSCYSHYEWRLLRCETVSENYRGCPTRRRYHHPGCGWRENAHNRRNTKCTTFGWQKTAVLPKWYYAPQMIQDPVASKPGYAKPAHEYPHYHRSVPHC